MANHLKLVDRLILLCSLAFNIFRYDIRHFDEVLINAQRIPTVKKYNCFFLTRTKIVNIVEISTNMIATNKYVKHEE